MFWDPHGCLFVCMQSYCAYTHFQTSRWKEKGMLEFFLTSKRETQKVKKNLSLVRGGTTCSMFFASSTQPLPPLCARALMHFSLPCIADNVTLEVFVKCCLAECVVIFPPRRALPKVMGLWLVLGVDPTLWYFLTFPLALRPYFYTCFNFRSMKIIFASRSVPLVRRDRFLE